MVSQLARKKVTVILNGDGGDENFAGYDRHIRFDRDAKYNLVKPYIPKIFLTGFKNFAEISRSRFLLQINRYIQKMSKDISWVFVDYNSYLRRDEKILLYKEFLQKNLLANSSYGLYQDKFDKSGCPDLRDQALYADMTTYLPDDLLTKIDIATMSCALEARSPLLDHKFVELACKIPYDLKVKNHTGKYIFKKALEKIIPKENIYRPKMGFSVPIQEWFLGSLKSCARDVILGKKSISRRYFNISYIKYMFDNHSMDKDFGPQLWALLVLELWFDKFIND
jgi:asparagine synthase (glutamine-hydrolysing)